MAKQTTIHRRIPIPKKMARIRYIISSAIAEACVWWRDVCLPGHFKPGAFYKYHYHNRTKKYIKRKYRLFGHFQPLVYTGRTQGAMLCSRAKPEANISVGSIKLPGDKYLHLKMEGWGGKRLRDEITVQTKAETTEQSKIIKKAIVKMANADSDKSVLEFAWIDLLE